AALHQAGAVAGVFVLYAGEVNAFDSDAATCCWKWRPTSISRWTTSTAPAPRNKPKPKSNAWRFTIR
ncbi:hypothetical protein, partial [Methylomonas koyamae]|uniref:hypothetical protein n=1 Tax=Methylomonas koyamae TaxID=702114 RepID=UPI0021108DB9